MFLACPACGVPLHKHGCMDYSLRRPKHSETISACQHSRKGFSLQSRETRIEQAEQHSDVSTSDPTVTGRSLVSGQLDDRQSLVVAEHYVKIEYQVRDCRGKARTRTSRHCRT